MADNPWNNLGKPAAKAGTGTTASAAKEQARKALESLYTVGQVGKKALIDSTVVPAELLGNVLGFGERINATRAAQARSNPRGVAESVAAPLTGGALPMLDPRGREELGNEAYAVFHPNDPSINANYEHAVGADKLLSTDPRFRGKAQNFAVHTIAQNLIDPLNYVGAGTGAGSELALNAFQKAGTKAIKAGSPTARMFLTNVAEREGGHTPEEIATINTVRQRDITRSRVQHSQDAQLLRKNKDALKKGQMPPGVSRRLLQEAYVWGTPDMRAQAVKFGFKPTASEEAKAPAGILNYNVAENYHPELGVTQPGAFRDLLLGEEERYREPQAGFEEHATGKKSSPETLYDRVQRRLNAGRSVVRFRSTANSLQDRLNMSPELASLAATDTKVGGVPILKALSRPQVDALLATGLPHGRNVGILGYYAMGEGGIMRATQFMAGGVPKELAERLEQGGSSHFGIREPGTGVLSAPSRAMPRVVRRFTTGALDRWDQSLRASRLEQVDKEFPKLTEDQKLDRVNQDLGAYNLKPHYVKLLSGIGANFPQWHNYIALTATGRALLRNPGRVGRLARAETQANDSFLGDQPYRVTLGGPGDETASAALDPARRFAKGRYPSYFGGASSIGPGLSLLLNAGTGLGEYAAGFFPFGNQILNATLNPYKDPAPNLARGLLPTLGPYTQKRSPGSMERTTLPKAPPPKQGHSSKNPWDNLSP